MTHHAPQDGRYRNRKLHARNEITRELRCGNNLQDEVRHIWPSRVPSRSGIGDMLEGACQYPLQKVAERFDYHLLGAEVRAQEEIRGEETPVPRIVPPEVNTRNHPTDFCLCPKEDVDRTTVDRRKPRSTISVEVSTSAREWKHDGQGFMEAPFHYKIGRLKGRFQNAPDSWMRKFKEHRSLLIRYTSPGDARSNTFDPVAYKEWQREGYSHPPEWPLNIDVAMPEPHEIIEVPAEVPKELRSFEADHLTDFKCPAHSGKETFSQLVKRAGEWGGDHSSAGYLYFLWFFELATLPDRLGKRVKRQLGLLRDYPPRERLWRFLDWFEGLSQKARRELEIPGLSPEALPSHHRYLMPEGPRSLEHTALQHARRLTHPKNTTREGGHIEIGDELRDILNAGHSLGTQAQGHLADFIEETVATLEQEAKPDGVKAGPWPGGLRPLPHPHARENGAWVGERVLQEAADILITDGSVSPRDLRKVWAYVRHDPWLASHLVVHPALSHERVSPEVRELEEEIVSDLEDPGAGEDLKDHVLRRMESHPYWRHEARRRYAETSARQKLEEGVVEREVGRHMRTILDGPETQAAEGALQELRILATVHPKALSSREAGWLIGFVEGQLPTRREEDGEHRPARVEEALAMVLPLLGAEDRSRATNRWGLASTTREGTDSRESRADTKKGHAEGPRRRKRGRRR